MLPVLTMPHPLGLKDIVKNRESRQWRLPHSMPRPFVLWHSALHNSEKLGIALIVINIFFKVIYNDFVSVLTVTLSLPPELSFFLRPLVLRVLIKGLQAWQLPFPSFPGHPPAQLDLGLCHKTRRIHSWAYSWPGSGGRPCFQPILLVVPVLLPSRSSHRIWRRLLGRID